MESGGSQTSREGVILASSTELHEGHHASMRWVSGARNESQAHGPIQQGKPR